MAMTGNTSHVNWSRLAAQIAGDKGEPPPPCGPHNLVIGSIDSVCGNIEGLRVFQRNGRPMAVFALVRLVMGERALPLRCLAFGRSATCISDYAGKYGNDPILLIGRYERREERYGETYSLVVLRSGRPRREEAFRYGTAFCSDFPYL